MLDMTSLMITFSNICLVIFPFSLRINVPWPTTVKWPFSYRFKIKVSPFSYLKRFCVFLFLIFHFILRANFPTCDTKTTKFYPHVPIKKKGRTPTN